LHATLVNLTRKELKEEVDTNADQAEAQPKATTTRVLQLWPGISDTMVSFGGLPIPQRLADAFTERGIVQPSGVQELVIPKIAEGGHVVMHAPTGGGKTLAYLLPMLARLQPTMHVGVQALVFVPTPELALQVARELKWLIYVLSGGSDKVCWFNPQVPQEIACNVLLSRANLWDAVRQDTAILVCTPGLLLSELRVMHKEAKRFRDTLAMFLASNVHTLICDEVDALSPGQTNVKGPLKLGAAEEVCKFIIDVVRRRYRNRPIQMIASSATANSSKVSDMMDRLMLLKYPKRRDASRREIPELVQDGTTLVREAAPGAKRPRKTVIVPIPGGIEHCVSIVRDRDDGPLLGQPRFEAMVEIVRNLKGDGVVLVFVPERVKLDSMVMLLRKAGIQDVSKYRSEVGLGPSTEQLADAGFERTFRRKGMLAPAGRNVNPLEVLQHYQDFLDEVSKGGRRIILAKMEHGRGLDLPNVDHVLLLEIPQASGEYLHLSGRTGRMGARGTTITVCTEVEYRHVLDGIELQLGINFSHWDVERGCSKDPMLSDLDAEDDKHDVSYDKVDVEEDMS